MKNPECTFCDGKKLLYSLEEKTLVSCICVKPLNILDELIAKIEEQKSVDE